MQSSLQDPLKPTADKMVIYQLMVRLFGNKHTDLVFNGTIENNGVGKFNDITDKALNELRNLGITHVWYTGILEHATMSDFTAYGIQPDDWRLVKGRAGSPFAIKDYFDVSPELAVNINQRLLEFEQLLQRTHEQGLKAIIDFIPNHVARSYHSDSLEGMQNFFGAGDDITAPFNPQNNFYYLLNQTFSPPDGYQPLGIENIPVHMKTHVESPAKVTGNNVLSATPGINDWFETIKLNFGVNIFNGNTGYFDPVPSTWKYLKEVLSFWAKRGVDGFRCDMAEMVPVEFWNWVIPQIKLVKPGVLFLAEIYIPGEYRNYLDTGKFDYIYDKAGLYDKLCAVLKGEAAAEEIYGCMQLTEGFSSHMLSFLENHDETRVASQHFLKNAWTAIPAMVVCCTISNGPVMIYFGQEVGETADVRTGYGGGNGRTTIYDYWNVPELQKWMNNGSFDGGLLNPSQKMLREFYRKILNIAGSYKSVCNGSMMHANEDIRIVDDESARSKFLFSYYRYTAGQQLLIITNFNRESFYTLHFNTHIDKWNAMNGNKSNAFRFTELIKGGIMQAAAGMREMLLEQDLVITIPPSGALIYLVENI